MLINTPNQPVNFNEDPKELIPFEEMEHHFKPDTESEDEVIPIENLDERYETVRRLVAVDYLEGEEKKSVGRLT